MTNITKSADVNPLPGKIIALGWKSFHDSETRSL